MVGALPDVQERKLMQSAANKQNNQSDSHKHKFNVPALYENTQIGWGCLCGQSRITASIGVLESLVTKKEKK